MTTLDPPEAILLDSFLRIHYSNSFSLSSRFIPEFILRAHSLNCEFLSEFVPSTILRIRSPVRPISVLTLLISEGLTQA